MAMFFRVLGILFSLVLMVGFGMCGVFGMVVGNSSAFALVCGLAGIAVALFFAYLLGKLLIGKRKPPAGGDGA